MGCSFSMVVVPSGFRTPEAIKGYYSGLREKMAGERTGDLGSDNGEVVIHEELNLDFPELDLTLMGVPLYDLEGTNEEEEIVEALEATEACKWGPTIAFRISGQWVLAGFYSD
jgi:hypothetical protein